MNLIIEHYKKFICEICSEEFNQNKLLKRHINNVHEADKYYCENCGKDFSNISALKSHIRRIHEDKYINSDVHEGVNHICSTCGKYFTHISGLKSHIRSHEGIRNGSGRPRKPENLYRKYICDLCCEEYDLIKDFKKVRFLVKIFFVFLKVLCAIKT